MKNNRTYSLPEELSQKIVSLLENQFAVKEPSQIAKCVQKLSDFYIENPEGKTPWDQSWCQTAYLSYYLPLNYLRACAVHYEGQRFGFFKNVHNVYDFGSGLGSGSFVFGDKYRMTFIEDSSAAQKLHQDIRGQGDWVRSLDESIRPNSLGLFSYSLTELSELPKWAMECDHLMIIEPSLRDKGRSLMELRQRLMEKGFFSWAPCTHQQACPLLEHKTDWCHDRIHFTQPQWFSAIEKHLPFKNRTLTMSYLLMSKTAPPDRAGMARLVGDFLPEKGKSRQLVCRGPHREYLSWMHKAIEPQELLRGELIEMPKNTTTVANELRVSETILLVKNT